jgi:hypothetical protein
MRVTPAGLRDHATEDHTRGCSSSNSSCECGYDAKTGRLLRAAAKRIEELEATARGYRERFALKREDEQDG